jgi:hypothetical protein
MRMQTRIRMQTRMRMHTQNTNNPIKAETFKCRLLQCPTVDTSNSAKQF